MIIEKFILLENIFYFIFLNIDKFLIFEFLEDNYRFTFGKGSTFIVR
jgi:hypothetical protein